MICSQCRMIPGLFYSFLMCQVSTLQTIIVLPMNKLNKSFSGIHSFIQHPMDVLWTTVGAGDTKMNKTNRSLNPWSLCCLSSCPTWGPHPPGRNWILSPCYCSCHVKTFGVPGVPSGRLKSLCRVN